MRVLVTGHLGYLGSVVTPHLEAAGYAVRGLDTGLFAAGTLYPPPSTPAGVLHTALLKDIRDVEAHDLRETDAIVHLAGLSNDPLGELRPQATYAINRDAAVQLAALARDAGVRRFVYASTCSVYGSAGDDLVDEDSPPRPVTAYARAKLEAEAGIRALGSARFCPTILRLATVYGPSARPRLDLVVNDLTARAVTTGEVLLSSDGTAWRPLVHTDDLARAIAAVLAAEPALVHDQVLNVGHDAANLRVHEIAAVVAAAVPGSAVRMRPDARADARSYRVCFARLAEVLPAAVPTRALAPAVVELAASYRAHGLSANDLEGLRYQRVRCVRALLESGTLDEELRAVALPASSLRCRGCGAARCATFLSLGEVPLVDALISPDEHGGAPADVRYPLELALCEACALVQIVHTVPPPLLYGAGYRYYASYAASWLDHARTLATRLIAERGLSPASLIVEVASNDGYLCRWFVEQGIPALGIEPAPGPAAAARALGVPTLERFFDLRLAEALARERGRADVVLGLNVLAHQPDPVEFLRGVAALLRPDGLAVFEVPYLHDLLDRCAFDTIYHEHVTYLSVTALEGLSQRAGLRLQRVEPLPTHGGSLRAFLTHDEPPDASVARYLERERASGTQELATYRAFAERVRVRVRALREDLLALKAAGRRIAAYGASAKGAALLAQLGVGRETIDYAVDRNVFKQGLVMPGCLLPIRPPEALEVDRPDVVLVLVWNLREEVEAQLAPLVEAGVRLLFPVAAAHRAAPTSAA